MRWQGRREQPNINEGCHANHGKQVLYLSLALNLLLSFTISLLLFSGAETGPFALFCEA